MVCLIHHPDLNEIIWNLNNIASDCSVRPLSVSWLLSAVIDLHLTLTIHQNHSQILQWFIIAITENWTIDVIDCYHSSIEYCVKQLQISTTTSDCDIGSSLNDCGCATHFLYYTKCHLTHEFYFPSFVFTCNNSVKVLLWTNMMVDYSLIDAQ